MLEGINERVKELSGGVFASGSRPGSRAGESAISTGLPSENDLLIAVIILGIIVLALIVIIIYGYCKYVRRRTPKGPEEMEKAADSPATADVQQPSLDLPPDATHSPIPVKTRKRSMTFSETDEECRKYREDLADSYGGPQETVPVVGERSRKKSVVTFVGVEEIDAADFHADSEH